MARHTFRAEVWEHSPGDTGSWHFLTVPAEVSDEVRLEAGPRDGFGSVRVEVSIGATTWLTSLFPDSTAGTFLLPVKAGVRKAEDLGDASTCEVMLEVVDQ